MIHSSKSSESSESDSDGVPATGVDWLTTNDVAAVKSINGIYCKFYNRSAKLTVRLKNPIRFR